MRRKEKEIKSTSEMYSIIGQAHYCNVAMSKDDFPYLVPMNFGFCDDSIYLHSAREGLKIDIVKNNPQVCIGIVEDVKIKEAKAACKTGMQFKSVTIFGKVEFITEKIEKVKALDCIVRHYYKNTSSDKKNEIQFDEDAINEVTILKVKIENITGKMSF